MNTGYMTEEQLQAAAHVRWVCEQYGLFGNIFNYTPCDIPGGNRSRFYMVAGIYPELTDDIVPKWLFPEDIVRKQLQNEKIFYPDIWAFDMTEDPNDVRALEKLVDYLKNVEFLKTLYAEYNVSFPKKLRLAEIRQLSVHKAASTNPLFPASVQNASKKDLNWFFKREKSKGLRKLWLDYFRSDKFPDDKDPIAKIKGFFNRHKQITTIEQLLEVNDSIRKFEMQEYEYRQFSKRIKELYPSVTYAISDVCKVDHGGVNNTPETQSALGRRVTAEEFAAIREERFATDGWAALENVVPAYWEFRNIYFKACDEPLVASIYNSITLEYAQCTLLNDMYDEHFLINVPAIDFMNFVSLAKANNVKFYIDNVGDFSIPSLDDIHVVCCEYQREKVYAIMERLVNDKVTDSHLF